MRQITKNALIMASIVGAFSAPLAGTAYAYGSGTTAAATQAESKSFIKKRKSIKGSFTVVTENGQTLIRFSDDFKTKNGPDLKVFLSPQGISDVTGKTAVNGALLLGELKSTKGTQDYSVPEGISLSDYTSVLVHCEEFAVLWGGSDL